jgi:hypothetical protein
MKILSSFKYQGADLRHLSALEKVLNGRSPELLAFYRKTNGFEMGLEPNYSSEDLLEELDCMRFYNVEFILRMLPQNERFFPGVLVIGGDAATNHIALDLRDPPAVPLIVFRADEEPYLHTARVIAKSFAEFVQSNEIQTAISSSKQIGDSHKG